MNFLLLPFGPGGPGGPSRIAVGKSPVIEEITPVSPLLPCAKKALMIMLIEKLNDYSKLVFIFIKENATLSVSLNLFAG